MVLKVEEEEVEAPQENPQIQSRERGAARVRVEGRIDQPWGRGVWLLCAAPYPSPPLI